ncbi:MAG: sigma 54-dependent Fis family transcriptional regulator [Deltaproteobacteria bacterium]|nr:sigma 54-dependent Fis family transcriptional regulator [Deltaproteobacteria bacterium]
MTDENIAATHLITVVEGGLRLVFNRFQLSVTAGPDAGREKAFGQELVQVGTARANDFVLTDRTVSRFHLKIDTVGDIITAEDLGSTNGTSIGGVRIRSAYLDGDVLLTLGTTKLRFRPLGDQAMVDLPAKSNLGGLIGGAPRMRQLYGQVTRIAASDLAVIVEGETGTGKDLLARVIHDLSSRAAKPFEVLDCSAIPENLIESELFGHVKGAFTGADRDRAGIFERAQGGTVFLDEIGELDLELQPKLLRVLENREVRRVGDGKVIKVDIRVVAATHRSLRALVNKGSFREDLYYRLAGCRLELPPLRDRPEDIPLLVEHFLDQLSARDPARQVQRPDDETVEMLTRHPWPGNVRQLKNAVERLAVLGEAGLEGDSQAAGSGGVALDDAANSAIAMPLREAKDAFERAYLSALVRRHGTDTERASKAAEVHPKSLLRMLRRHAIDRD